MIFPYTEYRGVDAGGAGSLTLYRPVVPVYFRGGGRIVRRLGLVDSGSDFTLLPTRIAAALGVALDAGEMTPISGVDGTEFAAGAATVELELRRRNSLLRWKSRVHFADQEYVLLGNQGFLEFFIATLDWTGRKLTLSPNERFPLAD